VYDDHGDEDPAGAQVPVRRRRAQEARWPSSQLHGHTGTTRTWSASQAGVSPGRETMRLGPPKGHIRPGGTRITGARPPTRTARGEPRSRRCGRPERSGSPPAMPRRQAGGPPPGHGGHTPFPQRRRPL